MILSEAVGLGGTPPVDEWVVVCMHYRPKIYASGDGLTEAIVEHGQFKVLWHWCGRKNPCLIQSVEGQGTSVATLGQSLQPYDIRSGFAWKKGLKNPEWV